MAVCIQDNSFLVFDIKQEKEKILAQYQQCIRFGVALHNCLVEIRTFIKLRTIKSPFYDEQNICKISSTNRQKAIVFTSEKIKDATLKRWSSLIFGIVLR